MSVGSSSLRAATIGTHVERQRPSAPSSDRQVAGTNPGTARSRGTQTRAPVQPWAESSVICDGDAAAGSRHQPSPPQHDSSVTLLGTADVAQVAHAPTPPRAQSSTSHAGRAVAIAAAPNARTHGAGGPPE